MSRSRLPRPAPLSCWQIDAQGREHGCGEPTGGSGASRSMWPRRSTLSMKVPLCSCGARCVLISPRRRCSLHWHRPSSTTGCHIASPWTVIPARWARRRAVIFPPLCCALAYAWATRCRCVRRIIHRTTALWSGTTAPINKNASTTSDLLPWNRLVRPPKPFESTTTPCAPIRPVPVRIARHWSPFLTWSRSRSLRDKWKWMVGSKRLRVLHVERKVSAHGQVHLDLRSYYIDVHRAGQRVTLQIEAESRSLLIWYEDTLIKTMPLRGFSGGSCSFARFAIVDETTSARAASSAWLARPQKARVISRYLFNTKAQALTGSKLSCSKSCETLAAQQVPPERAIFGKQKGRNSSTF
jgi:hypothetical protein